MQTANLENADPTEQDVVKLIDKLVDHPSRDDFKLQIRRLSPLIYGGHNMMLDVINEFSLMSVAQVRNAIENLHGGGHYRLSVIGPHGMMLLKLNLFIDPVRVAPKIHSDCPRRS